MFRSKIIIPTIIFLILLICTSIIKNQTRIIEKKIYKLNKKITLKEQDINESQLDFYFLTSPAELESKVRALRQNNYTPIKNISFGYNFSLTEDLNTFEYNSLMTKIKFKNLTTQFDYLEERGAIGQNHILENKTNYSFNDSNFLTFNTRKNRKLDLTEYYNLIYEYKNDCLVAGIRYKKNYYNDADIKPVEELFFSITIIPLTTFSPSKMALN